MQPAYGVGGAREHAGVVEVVVGERATGEELAALVVPSSGRCSRTRAPTPAAAAATRVGVLGLAVDRQEPRVTAHLTDDDLTGRRE